MKRKILKLCYLIIVIFTVCMTGNVAMAAGTNLSTATSMSIGNSVSGSVKYSKEYYQFSISQNSIIYMKATTGGHTQHLNVYVRDSTGASIDFSPFAISTNDNYNWGYQSGARYMALNAGTYFIEVNSYNSGVVTYTLDTHYIALQNDTIKIAGNNNYYLSSALSFSPGNTLASVAYNNNSYCHYYKFSIPSKQCINLNTEVIADGVSVSFDLFNAQGQLLESVASSVKVGSPGSYSKELDAGTYYIGVWCSLNRGRYVIRTSASAAATQAVSPAPSSVKVKSVKSNKKKRLTVKWTTSSTADYYQVQISRKASFKNSKIYTVYGKSKNSLTITKLSRGKKYYVRVRACRIYSGRAYGSSWSAKKSKKVK